MKRARLLLLCGAAALAAVIPSTPAAAAVQLSYFADSGDACRYGYTKGLLVLPSVPTRVVQVNGAVVDRPSGPGVPELCPDDGRFSFAILTAYTGNTIVDGERVPVDNATREYKFELTGVQAISKVSVQVCRQPRLPGGPPAYCGAVTDYRLPLS